MTRLHCPRQCDSRCYGSRATECCNVECAGGCTNGTSYDCLVGGLVDSVFKNESFIHDCVVSVGGGGILCNGTNKSFLVFGRHHAKPSHKMNQTI